MFIEMMNLPHFAEYAPICFDQLFVCPEFAPHEKKEDGASSDVFKAIFPQE